MELFRKGVAPLPELGRGKAAPAVRGFVGRAEEKTNAFAVAVEALHDHGTRDLIRRDPPSFRESPLEGAAIVAHQFNSVGSESAVAKFPAPLFYRRGEQSGDSDILANSSWHTEQVKKQPSFLLLAWMLGKPFIQTLERAFAQ